MTGAVLILLWDFVAAITLVFVSFNELRLFDVVVNTATAFICFYSVALWFSCFLFSKNTGRHL